jgi:hypothetical protein
MGKQKAIICDLDGTLALLNRDPYDASQCELDTLNVPVAKILRLYDGSVILVSGREDKYKPQTVKWLDTHEVSYDQLYMRKSGDFRKDFIVKKEIYDQYIKDNYDVEWVFDDRDQVVKLWREMGLTCFQVAYGDF